MIDILYAIIMLAICILGMLGAFFLGTRKFQERVFESSGKSMEIDESDVFQEPTEEEYQNTINTWKYFNGSEQTNEGSG